MRNWSALALCLASGTALADDIRRGPSAFGDWKTDAPGVQRLITQKDLPALFATRSAANPSGSAPRKDGQAPKAPPGFAVELFASGLSRPRVVRMAPNGDVFVAETGAGRIRVFKGDGVKNPAAGGAVFAEGLDEPFGIAFYPPGPEARWVYVASPGSVVRFPYRSGDTRASGPPQSVVRNLPGGGSHSSRDLAFSKDGETLYVSVGSATNVDEGVPAPSQTEVDGAALGASFDDERDRAAVLAFDPEGHHKHTFATGIRNCSGLTVQPATGALWCAVNERDGLGDDLPPDYATAVTEGAFYGWPWYYLGAHEDPRHKGARPDLAAHVTLPDVLIQAHSAPLGIAFYDGAAFPAAYRGDAFVALRGSWNRAKRTGYKVVRLRMKDDRPTGVYEDFLVGFVNADDSVWGRPVDVAVAQDGSLLVTDDEGGAIWRIRWAGKS